MWAVKILNGSQAGKIFQINLGQNSLGRSPNCKIRISSTKISKLHAHILCTEDKIIISDNSSSNGLFVNGSKIQNKVLKPGDKFCLGDILFDVIYLPEYLSFLPKKEIQISQNHLQIEESSKLSSSLSTSNSQENLDFSKNLVTMSFQQKIEKYIDEVALPKVYEYSSHFDLKYILMSFVFLFIITATVLSIFPVIKVSRDFVVDESTRRVRSLTQMLVEKNRPFIAEENEIGINIGNIGQETGVEKVFIINAQDGHVMAPAHKSGRYPRIPFIHKARKKSSIYTEVDGNQIRVSNPIAYHNSHTGQSSIGGYAIIFYNMDQVALDISRAVSLVIYILIINLIVGLFLYFLLYKTVTYPISKINKELDQALKESGKNVELKTPTFLFQQMVSNINSALSRMSSHVEDISIQDENPEAEAEKLVEMFPVAALAIAPDSNFFIACNSHALSHPLLEEEEVSNNALDNLTDLSLIENIKDLITKAQDNPNQVHSNSIPSSDGEVFEVKIKSMQSGNETKYHLIIFNLSHDQEDEFDVSTDDEIEGLAS